MSAAPITTERLESLLAYCKLTEFRDDPEVTGTIERLYQAAMGYLADAGVDEPEEDTVRRAQYDLAVNYLVLDGWDRRETSITSTAVVDNPSWRRLMNQLKMTGSAGLF